MGEVAALISLKLRRSFGTSSRAIFEQFVMCFHVPREEAKQLRAFQDGVAEFRFGQKARQVPPNRDLSVRELLGMQMA